jgi:hypothetical protein
MKTLLCHANNCNNSTSETFFHCEEHGGEDGEVMTDTVVICGDCLYPINKCEHRETGE